MFVSAGCESPRSDESGPGPEPEAALESASPEPVQPREPRQFERERNALVVVKSAGEFKNNWFELEWYEPWQKERPGNRRDKRARKVELALRNPHTGLLFTVSVEWAEDVTSEDLLRYTHYLPEKLLRLGPHMLVRDAAYMEVGGRDAYRIFFADEDPESPYEIDQTIVVFDGGVFHCTARVDGAFAELDRGLLHAVLESLRVHL